MDDTDRRELVSRAAASDLVGARVSIWAKTEEEVQFMQDWFESRGIASKIVREPKYPRRYAIYRALPRELAEKGGYL